MPNMNLQSGWPDVKEKAASIHTGIMLALEIMPKNLECECMAFSSPKQCT